MTYEESIEKNITTSDTTRPNTPQVKIRNPQDADIFVNLIEILPNVDFALKGKMIILINGIPVLDDSSDSFRQYAKYPLSLGKKLERGQYIEIFAWNSTNTDSLHCDFNIHLSSEQKQIPSVAIPLTGEQKNLASSEFENIFPLLQRANATYTKLIDMKGYRKLIVLLSAVVYVDADSPTVLAGGDYASGQTVAVDGDVNTYDAVNLTANGQSKLAEIDFKTLQTDVGLVCSLLVGATVASGVSVAGRRQVWTKQNLGDAYTLESESSWNIASGSGSFSFITQDVSYSATKTFRYVKIVFIRDSGNTSAECRIKEVYNSALVGGTGSLSFEILDSSGSWISYIPSSEFGTVVQGSVAVSKILGDTIKSVSGQEYPLPSTQSRFRAKYIVAGGGMKNSIDVSRVA